METGSFQVIPLPQEVEEVAEAAPFVIKPSTTVCYPEGNEKLERTARFLASYIKEVSGTEVKVAMTEKIQQTLRDSAAARWTVLLLLAFAMFCSYIFMDILSPIKDLMQSTRGWDSTAFGTMQGSETFLNVFVFFLIFAGIILDKMGVRFTAILSGVVMLIGASLNWYAVTTAFQGSSLEAWFNNNLNYIPGFDELGISPFYRGMPASAKFAAVGFIRRNWRRPPYSISAIRR